MNKKAFWILLVIAAVMRVANLGAGELWYDEAFTVIVTRLPLPKMLSALAGDVHPPLFYILVWPVVQLLGTSEWVVRLPSLAFSLVGIWLAWRVAIELGWSKRAQWIGLGLMAITPFELHYAQEFRMYTLLQALVLWSYLWIIRRKYKWLWLPVALTIYTHNYGLLYLPPLFLIALVRELPLPVHRAIKGLHGKYYDHLPGMELPEAKPISILANAALPTLLFIPWGVVLFGQMQSVAAGYWIQRVTPGSVIYAIYMLFTGFSMPEPWQPAAVLVILGALVYTLWRFHTKIFPNRGHELVWMGFIPLALAVIISVVWRPILLFRGLIGSVPFIYLLVGWGFSRLSFGKAMYAWAIVGPVVGAGLYGHYYLAPEYKGLTIQEINKVRAAWQPGDVIVHVNDGSMVGWLAYADDLPQYKLAGCGIDPLGSLTPKTRNAVGIVEVELSDLEFYRAWIVWGEGPTSPMCEHESGTAIINQADVFSISRDDEYVLSGVWLYEENNIRGNTPSQ